MTKLTQQEHSQNERFAMSKSGEFYSEANSLTRHVVESLITKYRFKSKSDVVEDLAKILKINEAAHKKELEFCCENG